MVLNVDPRLNPVLEFSTVFLNPVKGPYELGAGEAMDRLPPKEKGEKIPAALRLVLALLRPSPTEAPGVSAERLALRRRCAIAESVPEEARVEGPSVPVSTEKSSNAEPGTG